jgi:hypothetical protein
MTGDQKGLTAIMNFCTRDPYEYPKLRIHNSFPMLGALIYSASFVVRIIMRQVEKRQAAERADFIVTLIVILGALSFCTIYCYIVFTFVPCVLSYTLSVAFIRTTY